MACRMTDLTKSGSPELEYKPRYVEPGRSERLMDWTVALNQAKVSGIFHNDTDRFAYVSDMSHNTDSDSVEALKGL